MSVLEMPAAGQGVTLVVQSSIHGHIRVPLTGSLAVGRALSSDLVLADRSIGDHHLRIHAAGLSIVLEAIGQPVKLANGSIEPGQRRTVREACSFHAGDVAMFIDIAVPPAKPRKKIAGIAASVMLTVAFMATAAYAFGTGAAPTRPAVVVQVEAPFHAEMDVGAFRPAVLGELERRNLTGVELEALPDGSHRATGTILPQALEGWHEVKRWADGAFAGKVMLIDNVTAAAKAPLLAIQSAWLGDVPYIIDGEGEKLLVGAVLADGWTIHAIEAGRVLVHRQGQNVVIRF